MASGVGAELAFGGNAVNDLRDALIRRQMQQQQMQLAQRGSDRADQALAQQGELHQAQLQALTDAKAEAARQREEALVMRGVTLRPIGAAVSPGEYQRETALGVPQGLYGQQGVQEPQPPESLAANPMVQGTLRTIPGTVADSPATGRPFTFGGTQQQLDKQAEQDRQTAKDAATEQAKADELARQQERDKALGKYQDRMATAAETRANKPTATPTVTIQTTDDQGNRVTRIVPKTAGSEFKAPSNASLDTRLASAKAVVQTGNDMVKSLSDPKLASQLGPALGRYNNVLDFVGNPPPEFAKLAGQIESYSLANMGVHGMRANSGAEAIKATLGAGRHTPETIIAIINGLNGFANHLLENEGRTTESGAAPAAGTKPSAADLIKKYGGK